MKLYFAPGTCALAPHIALEWASANYDTQGVKLGDPVYLKVNPLGAVPALEDGNRLMTQADAILKYIAEKYPEAELAAQGTIDSNYELDKWLAFLTGDLHPAFYPYFSPGRYTVDESEEAYAKVRQAGSLLIAKFLTHLDHHMKGKNHIALGKRTIADPYAFAMLRWAQPLDQYPELKRFFDSMMEDTGVIAALKMQGIK
ncbi:glutathione S-transferase [Sinobacterium caligoides]|uniref:Glutathione S-transferase n=1 Tax=Sinobacterium caligoides TaxID=933926 RepID=A0A3N2DKC9_9GAMM|nr:glutathione S-transferase N-terminal domain-containing protein [Sinobacterium caligoides]ROS00254.1 glutathione S-transferase [Sinobacterium caligoides]